MFNSTYKGKKVLITGHTGFKGSWLSIWLLKLGANVVGVSIDIPTTPSLFRAAKLSNKIKDYRFDIRDYSKLNKIILVEKPDFIFHLAAQPIVSESYKSPVETINVNVMGTVNILESVKHLKYKCTVIIITSDKCYENLEWVWGYKETDLLGGKDIYSASKACAEIVFHSYFHSFLKHNKKIGIATGRAGNVVGGGDWAKDRIVPDAIRSWQKTKSVEIRSPKSTRPWQHVLEPLSGYLTLAMHLHINRDKYNGKSYNFGPNSESNITVLNMIKDLSSYWTFSKKSFKPFLVVKNRSFHEAGLLKLNCDKAHYELNWKPTLDYKSLISFIGAWYKSYYSKNSVFEFTTNQIEEFELIAKQKHTLWAKSKI